MDAKEMASMVNGWPEAARPMMDCGWADSVGMAAYNEGACSLEEAELIDADHACMSGLRWLRSQRGTVKIGSGAMMGGSWGGDDCTRGWSEVSVQKSHTDISTVVYTGDDDLHAIDAAIRAVEGEKK